MPIAIMGRQTQIGIGGKGPQKIDEQKTSIDGDGRKRITNLNRKSSKEGQWHYRHILVFVKLTLDVY